MKCVLISHFPPFLDLFKWKIIGNEELYTLAILFQEPWVKIMSFPLDQGLHGNDVIVAPQSSELNIVCIYNSLFFKYRKLNIDITADRMCPNFTFSPFLHLFKSKIIGMGNCSTWPRASWK